ncbi:MAG: SDR family oxidoreductase [Chloroflexi bacterium]|nr:SDR family oxidoreductase [Chloroflexota bacterium]
MDLHNRIALVTGGAHRVGKAIALGLARAGANVIVHYGSSAGAAQDTVGEIKALGVDAAAIQADLRQPDAIDALFAAVGEQFGRLDVLVNSAANFIREPFEDITVESWSSAMETNLRAPFLCTQRAAPLLRAVERPAEEPAAIVNITDLSGIFPWQNFTQHGVSKGGLIQLTRITARELAPDIRVNAVAPGLVLPPDNTDPARWDEFAATIPLLRSGNPEYVAQTVVFLAQHDYITGTVIPVDGGEHLLGTPYN